MADGGASTSGPEPLAQVRHLARHSALLVSSGAFAYAGALVLNVLLARTLGKEAFGAWVVAFSFAQLLSIVGLMGADWIVLRQGSYYHGIDDRRRLRATIHVSLVLSSVSLLILATVVYLLADVAARRVFHDPGLAPLLRLTAVVAPVIGIRQVLVYSTQAFKDMKAAALNRNVLQPLLRLAGSWVALSIVKAPIAAFAGLVAAEVLLAAAAYRALDRRIPLVGDTDPVDTKALVAFALPAWGSRLAGQSRSQIFPILLASLAGVSNSAVFAASSRIAAAPASIINTVNQVYSAMGGDLYLQGRRDEFAALYKSITKWTFTLGLPMFCLMVTFPTEVLSMFGGAFRAGEAALVILAVGVVFQFATGPVTVSLILVGRPRLSLLDYALVIAVEVGLAVVLMPRMGVLGAAIAKATGTTLNNILPLVQVYRIVGVHPYRIDFCKPIVAGVVAAATARVVVLALPISVPLVAAALGALVIGVVYLAVLLRLRLSGEDRAAIASIFARRTSGTAGDKGQQDV